MDDESGLPDRSGDDSTDAGDSIDGNEPTDITESSGLTDSSDSSDGDGFDMEAGPSVLSSNESAELTTTPREEAALQRVRKVSKLLDEAFRVPGTNFRIGLDPILGIVPGAGDLVSAALSLYPIIEAIRLDTPKETIAMMVGLVAVDAVIGSIPVFGDVFDAFWKANEWNVRLLERSLEQR